MQIDVGTIIYIIDAKEKAVVPARVNEQIVTKKINGETTTHKIEFPNGKSTVLEKLNAVHFSSLEDVRSHLMDRAGEMIDTGIRHAQTVAEEKFVAQSPLETPRNEAAQMQVTLPDGNTANIKVPEEYFNESPIG
jgi:hypothetical protein